MDTNLSEVRRSWSRLGSGGVERQLKMFLKQWDVQHRDDDDFWKHETKSGLFVSAALGQ